LGVAKVFWHRTHFDSSVALRERIVRSHGF
jgi:hypothetical protein